MLHEFQISHSGSRSRYTNEQQTVTGHESTLVSQGSTLCAWLVPISCAYCKFRIQAPQRRIRAVAARHLKTCVAKPSSVESVMCQYESMLRNPMRRDNVRDRREAICQFFLRHANETTIQYKYGNPNYPPIANHVTRCMTY